MSENSSRLDTAWRMGWALVALAILLAIHVSTYRSLTDDAFISFRYARNLAEGHGLVFNPGDPPVEGYTNFLWVVVLAGAARCGMAPETAAPLLGAAATLVLWIGVAAWGWRLLPEPRRTSLALVAPLALALNRSFSVWATSGLETRILELLLYAGVAALWAESRRLLRREAPRWPWAELLLALAVLTRPDALVIAGGAMAATEWCLWRGHATSLRRAAPRWLAFLLPIAVHLAWRLHYYGYPLPNTYYAKLSGRFFGDQGLVYFVFFVIEYALLLWVPFLVAGARAWRRHAPGLGLLLAAGLVPYVVYVICAGGDHFEFRLLDLLFVPLALLLQSGVAERTAQRQSRAARAAVYGAALALVGTSALLPTLSHLAFPQEYITGYPGQGLGPDDDEELVPRQAALLRLPGIAQWVDAYDRLACWLSTRFVGLRIEEHRAFVARTIRLGHQLRRMIDSGLIPADARIAIDCVGAIPYYSGLWTLDRLGLCDATVAHGPWAPGFRAFAHGKQATLRYRATRRVDFDCVHPYEFIWTASAVSHAQLFPGPPAYFAPLDPDHYLVAYLPLGPEHTARRFPSLHFVPLSEQTVPRAGSEARPPPSSAPPPSSPAPPPAPTANPGRSAPGGNR